MTLELVEVLGLERSCVGHISVLGASEGNAGRKHADFDRYRPKAETRVSADLLRCPRGYTSCSHVQALPSARPNRRVRPKQRVSLEHVLREILLIL